MCELLNEKLQQLFTKETHFIKPKDIISQKQMGEITARKDDIYKMMKELDASKATGPDGISGFILKSAENN